MGGEYCGQIVTGVFVGRIELHGSAQVLHGLVNGPAFRQRDPEMPQGRAESGARRSASLNSAIAWSICPFDASAIPRSLWTSAVSGTTVPR